MNTFEKTIEQNMEVAHKFTIGEIIIFDVYLLSFGIILALISPQIRGVDPWIYGIISAIGILYIVATFLTKNPNFNKRIERSGANIHLTKYFSYWDFVFYKVALMIFGIFLVQIFPVLGSIHIGWYVLAFGFGAGYFTKSIY